MYKRQNLANANPVTTRGVVVVDSDGFLSITYQQGVDVTDVLFEIQESPDLDDWATVSSPVLVEEEIDPTNQTKLVTLRLPTSVTQTTKKFLRVRMSR